MKHVHITELAESDLGKSWLYIARDNPDAADQFIDRLRAECQRLAAAPLLTRAADCKSALRGSDVGSRSCGGWLSIRDSRRRRDPYRATEDRVRQPRRSLA